MPRENDILRQFGEWLRIIRKKGGLSQEDLAEKAGFSRSYYTEIETGKRNISLLNLHRLAEALGVGISELMLYQSTGKIPRLPVDSNFINDTALFSVGLTPEILKSGIVYAYGILDVIDETLLFSKEVRISRMVELANLSSILGNLLGTGIASASSGVFERNRPHKFPDLLTKVDYAKDIEIKIALEDKTPKGHLVKPGYYLTFRYVLCDSQGKCDFGSKIRGEVVYIWECRVGYLGQEHFNTSSTEGDSGKTANINTKGMKNLSIVYIDLERCPYSPSSPTYKEYKKLLP